MPMRAAIQRAFREVTGHEANLESTGWGVREEIVEKLKGLIFSDDWWMEQLEAEEGGLQQ